MSRKIVDFKLEGFFEGPKEKARLEKGMVLIVELHNETEEEIERRYKKEIKERESKGESIEGTLKFQIMGEIIREVQKEAIEKKISENPENIKDWEEMLRIIEENIKKNS